MYGARDSNLLGSRSRYAFVSADTWPGEVRRMGMYARRPRRKYVQRSTRLIEE
jgi:hypothetical protein